MSFHVDRRGPPAHPGPEAAHRRVAEREERLRDRRVAGDIAEADVDPALVAAAFREIGAK